MRKNIKYVCIAVAMLLSYTDGSTQTVDEDQLGAWYMYFYNTKIGDSNFGVQGDFQFRYWDFGADLEQRLLRSGLTYSPTGSDVTFTLGYANIASGVPGDDSNTTTESRIYQEALLPHKVAKRIHLTHRFRYEQRWVPDQDLRTRYRYNIFMIVLLNSDSMGKGTAYLALYNEIFINGQTDIGGNRSVQLFDRNRTYLGVGYGILDKARVQLGWMRQTTANWAKGQMQVSLHHTF